MSRLKKLKRDKFVLVINSVRLISIPESNSCALLVKLLQLTLVPLVKQAYPLAALLEKLLRLQFHLLLEKSSPHRDPILQFTTLAISLSFRLHLILRLIRHQDFQLVVESLLYGLTTYWVSVKEPK